MNEILPSGAVLLGVNNLYLGYAQKGKLLCAEMQKKQVVLARQLRCPQ
jgi:hypothetical protein